MRRLYLSEQGIEGPIGQDVVTMPCNPGFPAVIQRSGFGADGMDGKACVDERAQGLPADKAGRSRDNNPFRHTRSG